MIEPQMNATAQYYWTLMESVQTCRNAWTAQKIAEASIEAWRGFVNQRAEMTRKVK